jgi:hypothetical protein
MSLLGRHRKCPEFSCFELQNFIIDIPNCHRRRFRASLIGALYSREQPIRIGRLRIHIEQTSQANKNRYRIESDILEILIT